MSVENGSGTTHAPGKVRWRRFAIVALPAAAIAALLIGLTSQGAIASSISVSGQEFLVTASELTGTGFEQFGGSVANANGSQPVIVSGINSAKLYHLCQSVKVGPVILRLTAGDSASDPVTASNLIVDASDQTGSEAVFKNIAIGQDAGTLDEDGTTTGQAGSFGEQARSVQITNLNQNTWLTTAGTFTLPNLSLGFGSHCP